MSRFKGHLAAAEKVTPIVDLHADVTEKFVAEDWLRHHHGAWRFDHTASAWFNFTGNVWEKDETRLALHSMSEMAKTHANRSKSVGKSGFCRGAETLAQADPRVSCTNKVWDTDDYLIATPGGTVDLRTGKLRAARPGDFITKVTAAAPERAVPSLWLKFLNEATGGDAEVERYLRQMMGYALTGDTSAHALFFVHGAGKNGKSVFLTTVTNVLGSYATTSAMDTFTKSAGDKHPTELARLNGARLVTASETEEGRTWAEARVKQLTGGDRIAARFMARDFFEFTPKFKLVIVGNHQPSLHAVDPATRRRFNIIPFDHTPAAPDPELTDKLKAEYGGILQWMIEGCLDWQQNGLVRPQVVIDATESYFDQQDLVGQWVSERCEIGKGRWDTPGKLFSSWAQFTRAAGEEPGTAKAFGEVLERRGFRRAKSGGVRKHVGLNLRADDMGDAWDRS